MAFRQIILSLRKSKLLLLLLAVFLANQLFMAAVFPMFQGPDEPVHYATIQNFSIPLSTQENKEFLRKLKRNESILKFSEEITNTQNLIESEKISFHSSSTQSFVNGLDGQNEDEIKNSNWEKKRGLDIVEGVTGYYIASVQIEKILSKSNIFIRFFGIRTLSIFFGILILILSYLSAKKIGFDNNISILLATLIGFQPIFSQTAAIINYDIMLVFSFSLFTYGAIWALKDGLKWKNILIMISALFLGIITKAPAIILVIISYFLAIYFAKKRFPKISNKVFFFYLIIATIFIASIMDFILPINYFQILFTIGEKSQFDSIFQSIWKYIEATKDRWSWSELSYWGNFGWLDTEISSWIVSLAHWIEIVGILGIIAYFVFPKKIPEFLPKIKYIIFLIGILLGLQFAIRFADWNHFNNTGKIEIGTPGRYFLPVIFAQFSLIIIGIGMLVRKYSIWKNIIKILAISMILLWTYSVLIIIIPRYYL